ncbi:type IV pilus biogenesis/stability protein PilW [Oxalobacteraceae bacterium OM1]|nr:type IV pilus biogenesis/stability protein PilW [Oxalobacteraceae bacterium OM1]
MKLRAGRLLLAAIAVSGALLGCAGGPAANRGELPTASDQTDNQKRARIRLQLAIGYYEQRQLPVALDEIKLALQADPNFAEAYVMRGLVYMDMGETRLADDNFQQGLRLSPNNPDFNNNYGWFLCQNGREKESIAYFENALKNRAYQSPAKALNNAGMCTLKLKDKATAERYFTRAFQTDPSDPITNLNLSKLYFERRDYERSRFYVGRVIKAEALTPEALWLAIRIEHKLGDRAAEASLVAQLRRRFPGSVEYAAFQRGAYDE